MTLWKYALSGGDQVSLLRDFFFSRGGHPSLLDQLGFETKDTSQQLVAALQSRMLRFAMSQIVVLEVREFHLGSHWGTRKDDTSARYGPVMKHSIDLPCCPDEIQHQMFP